MPEQHTARNGWWVRAVPQNTTYIMARTEFSQVLLPTEIAKKWNLTGVRPLQAENSWAARRTARRDS